MKRSILLGLLALAMCTAALAQSAGTFKLTGDLQNFDKLPNKIYMIAPPFHEKVLDSADVKDGEYVFHGNIQDAYPVILSVTPQIDNSVNGNQVHVYIKKGEITLVHDGKMNEISVSGPGADAHGEFQKVIAPLAAQKQEIDRMQQDPRVESDPSFRQTLSRQATRYMAASLNEMLQYCRAHPEAQITPYLTYMLVNSQLATKGMSDTLYRNLPEAGRSTPLRRNLDSIINARAEADLKQAAEVEAKTPLGSIAPDFSMPDTAGNMISLSQFRGQYVLLDFWASWCGPCRYENPYVVKAFNKYHPDGFTVVGVSLDGEKNRDAWLKAIKDDGLGEWPQLSNLKAWECPVAQRYGFRGIPANYLLDPEGRIVAKNLRGKALDEKLAELFSRTH